MSTEALSVTKLTSLIKNNLESDFSSVQVIGEISNFKPHNSGHWYFTLKDADAQISAVMWRTINSTVRFLPEDGMRVILAGKITVYMPRGTYQIDTRFMQPAGIGDLQIAFERLKLKLETEGLFAAERKKELPSYPEKIGIVTAPDGAALQDMINAAARRFPVTQLIISPCRVQGEGAAESIIAALRKLHEQHKPDVILVARGGGSLEDLWAFNEEKVARAIAASEIPIVTGIGHEVDFTIADYVADKRAATPTAAMEIVTPDLSEQADQFSLLLDSFERQLLRKLRNAKRELSGIIKSYGFRRLPDRINQGAQQLDQIAESMNRAVQLKTKTFHDRLNLLRVRVHAMDKEKILKKGFVLVSQGDKFVSRAKYFSAEKRFNIHFYDAAVSVNNPDEKKR